MLAGSAVLEAQEVSIVYIDSERLRREAPGLQEAGQQLQQRMQQLETQADSALAPLQQELRRLQSEYQQQQGTMTQATRQQQQQAIQAKQTELQQEGSQWEQRAAALQNEILAPALSQINDVINELREERNYAFILDAAAGGVVAADPSRDITDEVLSRLPTQANTGS
ncbi:MAG: OmpH family outer membrane protein [Gemmatimonadota bacterium]